MRIKHTVVKVKARKHHLGVMIEVQYPGTLRWVEVRVPWRMLNEQYRAVVEAMEDEALLRLRLQQEAEQPMLPGID